MTTTARAVSGAPVRRTGGRRGGAALLLLAGAAGPACAEAVAPTPPRAPAVDPRVKASAYADKTVWSYHSKDPLPWSLFRPGDYGSSKIDFNAAGVRPVGKVPAPGVHPRIFFSPDDLPAIRRRIREDRGAREAWKNILCYAHAIKLTYDEKADYAQPDWANGRWHVHGRTAEIHRIGGYNKNREDYFGLLASGKPAEKTFGKNPSGFFFPAAIEAYRCLIDDDAEGAKTLARAVETSVRLEQARRAREDKPVGPGQPPKPSTPRYACCNLGLVYDFIHTWLTPEQKRLLHDELVLLSSWSDNYGTFNNAEASRSNWATFTYWVWDLMAIEGEPGFNDLKFLGLYRGWRNFLTYSFFDSGAAYEAEGKLLFGLDAVVAFDRVAHKYGLEPLSCHPLVRAHYAKFTALSVLPTQDGFAVFDILGGMGRGLCTPQDLVVAHYLYPDDAAIDFVYRATVGDDYRHFPMPGHSWNNLITCGVFATSHRPEIVPEKLNLPLSFFCGQRALMMTRSSWDRSATFLTLHVRGASGGHPYPDRNGIMLAAQGRPWVTIPFKNVGGWACNTIRIDGAEQSETTPARVVDYVDTPGATFMTGDAQYCWDWVWRTAGKNRQGGEIRAEDVLNGNVDMPRSWALVDQCFNDFAFARSEREIYRKPLKLNASWIAVDGILSPVIRQVNAPVLRAFRTAGLVRGPRPYVLVVDDVQRDALPARYEWNLTLPADVVRVQEKKGAGVEGDILLAGKASLGSDGAPRAGEPLLLIRLLGCEGERLPVEVGPREQEHLLSIRTVAVSPDFKVLLHAFRMGDPLPRTAWNPARTSVSVEFPDQKDVLDFSPAASGRTHVAVRRDGVLLAKLDRPVVPLNDPETASLTERLARIPGRLMALRRQAFDPARLPGFVAGWDFDKAAGGVVPPAAGSAQTAAPIPLGDRTLVEGLNGRRAVAVGPEPLRSSLGFAADVQGTPFTVACWLKTKVNPWMGGFINIDGVLGSEFIQGGLRLHVPRLWDDNWASSMLSCWTHVVFAFDGARICVYRNGIPLSSVAVNGTVRLAGGKTFSLGGKSAYGDAEVAVQSVHFFKTALAPEAVEDLYLWGRAGGPAGPP